MDRITEMNKSIPEAVVEAVARAICAACEDDPDSRGDARGNKFRWQDYRDVALAATSAFTAQAQPKRRRHDPSGQALEGMTMRDYFAAKAMAALIAEPVSEGRPGTVAHWADQVQGHTGMSGADIVAHVAYMMADAMLRARGK